IRPGGDKAKWRRQDAVDKAQGILPPTKAGFSAARKPGASFIGQQPRERVRHVLSRVQRYGTPNHWSKRTARQLVTYIANKGRQLEGANPQLTFKHNLGRAMKHFAYGITTLGNLPGQGYYLSLRSQLMGDINAGIDH